MWDKGINKAKHCQDLGERKILISEPFRTALVVVNIASKGNHYEATVLGALLKSNQFRNSQYSLEDRFIRVNGCMAGDR